MKRFWGCAVLLCAVSACGQKADVDLKNASVDEVAKATRDAQKLEPGLWKTTVEIVAVEMPGMPPEQKGMADAMTKAMQSRKNVSENCVTKEDAEKPPAKMLGGDGSCTFENFKMAGGRLDAKMICKPQGGPGQMAMTMNGSFGGESYALDSQMTMSGMPGAPGGAGGGAAMVVKAKTTGERIGECKKS